jgi:hypothetical protein
VGNGANSAAYGKITKELNNRELAAPGKIRGITALVRPYFFLSKLPSSRTMTMAGRITIASIIISTILMKISSDVL